MHLFHLLGIAVHLGGPKSGCFIVIGEPALSETHHRARANVYGKSATMWYASSTNTDLCTVFAARDRQARDEDFLAEEQYLLRVHEERDTIYVCSWWIIRIDSYSLLISV